MQAVLDRPSLRSRQRSREPLADSHAAIGHEARMRGVAEAATLEDAIVEAWHGLTGHSAVSCLVCGGAMAPRYGAAGAAPVGGRCGDCGATLG